MELLSQIFQTLSASLFFLCFFGLICIVLQKISPSIKSQRIYRAEFFTDFYFWFLLSITAFLITAPFTNTVIKPLEFSGLFSGTLKNTNYYFKIFLGIVLADFTGYWMHRLFHSRKLWKFHTIHHSPLEIDWLSSARFHPVESVIVIITIYIIGIIIIGFSFIELTTAVTIRSWYGYLVHSNVSWGYGKFGKIIASPYFHRWHHTTRKEGLDKNFAGVFSAWDYLFGTAYNPQGLQPSDFGVGHKVGNNLWEYIKYPFVK